MSRFFFTPFDPVCLISCWRRQVWHSTHRRFFRRPPLFVLVFVVGDLRVFFLFFLFLFSFLVFRPPLLPLLFWVLGSRPCASCGSPSAASARTASPATRRSAPAAPPPGASVLCAPGARLGGRGKRRSCPVWRVVVFLFLVWVWMGGLDWGFGLEGS